MMYLIASFWLPMLLSALVGVATGWWMWRAGASEDTLAYASEPAPIIPPAPPEPEVEAEVEPEPEPAPEPEPEPDAPDAVEEPVAAPSPFRDAPDGEPDKLTLIKGVGPKLSDMLHGLGVFHFAQIAEWDDAQVAEVDSQLGNFKGRVARDRWVDQARLLAARNVAAFEREFGKMNGSF